MPARPETAGSAPPKVGETVRVMPTAIPSQAREREGVEARRAAPNGSSEPIGEGMVQRTNAACGERESASVMKGEVVSSILTGSTT